MKIAKPFAVEEAAADEGKTNEKKYDCQEDDVVYMYRKFPDAPAGFKERKTDTWQECQKECAEMEPCKGFADTKRTTVTKKFARSSPLLLEKCETEQFLDQRSAQRSDCTRSKRSFKTD